MKKSFTLFLVLVAVFLSQAKADEPIGVFCNLNTNSIQFINPLTFETSGSLLKGDLGSYGGGLIDAAITSDGKKAMVSNFGDTSIYFIDISGGFHATPAILGSVTLPFFAEDMALSPNDKYLYVTDGGFSSVIGLIDVDAQRVVKTYDLGLRDAQAVAITPDGKLLIVADYWGGELHTFSIADDGKLSFKESQIVLPSWPANLAISPDGKTLIVVCGYRSSIPIFKIDSRHNLVFVETIPLPSSAGQTCVFSQDGTKAYYSSNSYNQGAQVHVLNITGPGQVTASRRSISMSIPRGLGHLYGVDTMAIDPSGNYLYCTNPTTFGSVVEITVIDLATEVEVLNIFANGFPVGIAFATIKTDTLTTPR